MATQNKDRQTTLAISKWFTNITHENRQTELAEVLPNCKGSRETAVNNERLQLGITTCDHYLGE